jgi:hypothetical protein
MTIHPQTKRPWLFQPWNMTLSGQYVPGLKLINAFYAQVFFIPGSRIPANILPFWGLCDHPKFSNIEYYFWSMCRYSQFAILNI